LPRVLVVSDIRLFQDSVAALLERECSVAIVGTARPPYAPAIAAELAPDIVLLDMTVPGNLDCAKRLAEQPPPAKVVAFGVGEVDAEIVALAAAGVAGYLRRDASIEDVAAVLASAMRDEFLCSPRDAAALCHQVALLSRNGHAGPDGTALSRRELQIARLIDRGLSNKEIARQLGIQATTVKNHVHNILDKLKVHRRGEAAACLRSALRERAHAPTD
jgi:DNA-binding NarL/FixJ family response regulator